MKLTQEAVLRDTYDVIVIGAGLGGLTAASLLAKRGLSVLMIEQQNKPGGACTSFKREDRIFDAGAAMLYGFGDKGFRPFRFVINELEESIDVIAPGTLARMTFEGQEIIFWPDLDRFVKEMGEIFPDDKDGLRRFYDDLHKMYDNIVTKNEVICPPSEFSPRQGLRRLLSDPLTILKMQRLLSTSTLDLLKKYIHSPKLINFYDKLCSAYAYTTAQETPAVMAATMFIDNHIGGVYFPAGGAQMLPNTIEKAFERCGGQALYHQSVDEILIQNGKAYGVRLQNGLEIYAERVVANATVWNIYGKLIRPEHIPPQRLEWVKSLIPTFPSMTLYMVVDREAIPEGSYPWEIFIENCQIIDSSDLTLYINSLLDDTLCPPDELVVMAIAPNLAPWPHPGEPGDRSPEYEAQKQHEAGRMLAQIEQHIPGFRQHIRQLMIGTPTTIERYLLKNGGAVGGPKNQIGQEMLNRLHARSEWKHLYFCGDSTVMGTGAPATVVSGVGAANVILRELHLPEYDSRHFPHEFVHFVNQPFQRPAFTPSDPISEENAFLAAAQCQFCQEPECVKGCPAGIDIPGFLRRMEVKNYAGAARLIRAKNPFGETCGQVCPADQLCQRNCNRRDFTGKPVRIAELQRWVCKQAGDAGWTQPRASAAGGELTVIGGGPAGMTCAYYLALAGCEVNLYAREDQPGGKLWQSSSSNAVFQAALQRDLQGIRSARLNFQGSLENLKKREIDGILTSSTAVFLAEANNSEDFEQYSIWLGPDWRTITDRQAGAQSTHSRIFLGEDFLNNGVSVVEAVACGRKAAIEILEFLHHAGE